MALVAFSVYTPKSRYNEVPHTEEFFLKRCSGAHVKEVRLARRIDQRELQRSKKKTVEKKDFDMYYDRGTIALCGQFFS